MLTLFTSPRSFVEPPFGSMQRNAIRSWLALQPPPQIVLFGNDDGVAEVARELALLHMPDVESDRRGAPMRSAMCELAGRVAKHDLLCSINADIIILDGFGQAVERLISDPDPRLGRGFVAAGRRHNLDVDWEVDFADPDWRTLLRDCVRRKGELFIPSAMDYFIYPKSASPSARLSFPGEAPGWDPAPVSAPGLAHHRSHADCVRGASESRNGCRVGRQAAQMGAGCGGDGPSASGGWIFQHGDPARCGPGAFRRRF